MVPDRSTIPCVAEIVLDVACSETFSTPVRIKGRCRPHTEVGNESIVYFRFHILECELVQAIKGYSMHDFIDSDA